MKPMPSLVRPRFGPTGIGGGLARPGEGAGDDARVPEIVAHQALDALLRQGAGVTEDFSRLFLQRVEQLVLIAFAFEVQDRSDPQQKVFRIVDSRRILGSSS